MVGFYIIIYEKNIQVLYMELLIDKVKRYAAGRAVVMPVFGDAESMATVAVALKACGSDNVHVIHIDHGLLRDGECEAIRTSLAHMGVKNTVFLSLEKAFMISSARMEDGHVAGPLQTACDPAEKRNIVFSTLKKIFKSTVEEQLGKDVCMLGVHSVGGEGLDFGGKAEEIARENGVDEFLIRQPFPFQGLAIRMLCNESPIAVTTEQRTMLESLVTTERGDKFSSKLVPYRSVGIRNGVRSYKSMAVICGVGDSDFSDAAEIAQKVYTNLSYVNRVIVRADSMDKVSFLHGSPMHISKETLDTLRKADAIVAKEFNNTSAVQFFAVLLPFASNTQKKYSVAIRAVSTSDFKSAKALVPAKDFDVSVLRNTAKCIKEALPEVDMVLYDITPKPPAAIEFE